MIGYIDHETLPMEVQNMVFSQFGRRTYFDVESLPNYFGVSFSFADKRRLCLRITPLVPINQVLLISALWDYLVKNEIELVSFNGEDYDIPLMRYLYAHRIALGSMTPSAAAMRLKQVSDLIISSEVPWSIPILQGLFVDTPPSIDFYRYWTKMLRQSQGISLKGIGIQLGYEVVQDLPVKHNEYITAEQMQIVETYNAIHDVGILLRMDESRFNWQGQETDFEEMIGLRKAAIQEFGFSQRALSWDAVKLGLKVLLHQYTGSLTPIKGPTEVALKSVLSDRIRFQHPTLVSILDRLKRTTVATTTELVEVIHLHNTIYDLKSGGLHNRCKPGRIVPNEDQIYIDVDVASYYPKLMIEEDCSPIQAPGLSHVFLSMFNERIALKKIGQGKGARANLIKLSLNGSIGSINQFESPIYDMSAFLKVTVNGQLFLLMLCEMLYNEGAIIDMANTDGVSIIVNRSDLEKIRACCAEWEQQTRMILEEVEYDAIYRLFGNSYAGVKNGKVVKQKGAAFITNPDLGKSADFLIVPHAVNRVIEGDPDYKSFIRKPDHDIRLFCGSQKVGKDYEVWYGDVQTQRTNRYFVSESGTPLLKKRNGRFAALNKLKGTSIQLLNTLPDDTHTASYDIHYEYYDRLVEDILVQIDLTHHKKPLTLF